MAVVATAAVVIVVVIVAPAVVIVVVVVVVVVVRTVRWTLVCTFVSVNNMKHLLAQIFDEHVKA